MGKDYSDRAKEAELPTVGTTGEVVKTFQAALRDRGYDVGDVDGIYGEKTRTAISNLQNTLDLEVTGILDQSTIKGLFEQAPVARAQATPTFNLQMGTNEASLAPTSTTQKTLRKVEAGSYDTLYGNYERKNTPFKGVSVSNMTIGELAEFSRPSGAYGQYVKPRLGKNTYAFKQGLTSTPMGKYQIVGSTLLDLANRMKLPADTVFNKQTQDSMFLFLARENVAKGATLSDKRKNLRSIWEGFKKVDNATLDRVIQEIGN